MRICTCASLLVRESCEGVGEVGSGEEELSRDKSISTLPFAELGRGIISARDVMLRTRVCRRLTPAPLSADGGGERGERGVGTSCISPVRGGREERDGGGKGEERGGRERREEKERRGRRKREEGEGRGSNQSVTILVQSLTCTH